MTEGLAQGEAVLEVISPDGARKYVRVTQTPFLIGRGAETGNHLQLTDRRISRNCAAIVTEANRYYLEDRGARRGVFVNGEKQLDFNQVEVAAIDRVEIQQNVLGTGPSVGIRSVRLASCTTPPWASAI